MLPRLSDGTHLQHPLASRKSVRHVEFNIPVPVDVLIDGEIFSLECRTLDILPAAVDVYI
jgi:diacylglycerol kinase family enzyme